MHKFSGSRLESASLFREAAPLIRAKWHERSSTGSIESREEGLVLRSEKAAVTHVMQIERNGPRGMPLRVKVIDPKQSEEDSMTNSS